MSHKQVYGFTIDLQQLIGICLQDPATEQMVYAALRGAKERTVPHTTPLGAANFKDNKEDPDLWYSVFVGTSTKASRGQEGFIIRNESGNGPRISVRLKRQQQKTHAAKTPGQVLPTDTADLVKKALSGDAEAAKSVLAMAEQQKVLNIEL